MFALQSLGQTGQSQCCYSAVDNTEKQFRGQKEKKNTSKRKNEKKKGPDLQECKEKDMSERV